MTNEEALLRALNGEELTVTEFQPQTNKQAYLAYAVGLITDPELLPEPRTNEEVLLKELCLNGTGGGGSDLIITSAAYLFYYGHRNQNLNELLAACGKVTSCSSMFESCASKFKSLDLSILDTSECVNMSSMFKSCSGLESITFGGKFDTGQVNNMSYMFSGCKALTELDVSNFDTTNVTNMQIMFLNCENLTELDVTNFVTSNVTTMQSMFSGCEALTELDVSNFDTTNVTNMQSMFNSCEKLAELDVSNFDTANVTNMSYMFNGCKSLTELDLSYFDTAKVTDMSYMLHMCYALEEIVGFSATNKAGLSIVFPYGQSSAPMALKRLTFRTDLGEGVYSIRSAINIKYCSFDRDGMVEMFNSLPDINSLNLSSSYKTITITGNPCVTDGSLTDSDKAIATNKGWVLTI